MKSSFSALLNREVTQAEGDTIGPDGLIYCGKCGEPRQFMPPEGSCLGTAPLRRACRCEREQQDREEAERKQKAFESTMASLSAKYNIPLPWTSKATFAADDSPDSIASKVCRNYVKNWEKMKEEGAGLLFYGTVGTGKSFYAEAVVNALLEKQVAAAVTSFPRLLNVLQGKQDRQVVIDSLSAYQLLVLDDLGVERDSAFAVEQVYNVIDARARSKLPLIVTTNLPLADMQKPEPVSCARIYDRVMEMCPIRIPVMGKSRRAGNTQQRAELEKLLYAE